ncbi:glycosyltransferase family 2 protein [Clostridium felsineum]|uniref:glycosyltransferase family 2 protein n=1 Tax=Clostridium felsineum TaxID=36839 RepID=UPI00214DEC85|nr:glycosyltransferase family 2 protein [Clostridium felsineum]MCR3757813.1 glycosyltransferase family 2 protein [Clostridium felsineum]
MREVCVIICNYNKKDYLLKCIDSVLKSSYKDFDIYLVDNASTDGSVAAVKHKFCNKLDIIENVENLGGAGGFYMGIKFVINEGYKYIYLLDNDVIIHEDSLKSLVDYMDKNQNIGAVGSKIYSLDNPQIIQEFGSFVDWENFNMKLMNKGKIDYDLCDNVKCDYVPACSALFRVDALKVVGNIDKEYFVYWDDIDLCHRLKLQGYEIWAINDSKVWHKGGGNVRRNTFGTYYFWRNRIHFFLKYSEKSKVEEIAAKLFDEVFDAVYACNYIGKYNSAKTISSALEDAIHNVRGKVSNNKILEVEKIEDRFNELLKGKKSITIINNNHVDVLRNVINRIKTINNKVELKILSNKKLDTEQFKECKVLKSNEYNLKGSEIIIKLCNHIIDMRNELYVNIIYVDRYFNIIASEEDRKNIGNYENMYHMMRNIWYPSILDRIKKLNI